MSETEGRRAYICTSMYKDIWEKESLSKFVFSWTLYHWLQNDSLLTSFVWLKHCFVSFFGRRRDILLPTDSRMKTSKHMNKPDFLVGLKNAISGRIQHYWINGLELTLQFAKHLTTFYSLCLVMFLCLTL